MEINTIEGLRDSLSKPKDLICKGEGQFENLAKALMNNFQIQKGKTRYWMTEIEFYLFTDEHRDIITYPRRSKAGMWFFHASGVDLSFESSFPDETPETFEQKPFLAKGAVFGGILIRGIVPVKDIKRKVSGPIKVCDELFDQFNALGGRVYFPKIVTAPKKRGVEPTKESRYGFSKDDKAKVHSILSYNYRGYDEKAFPENELVKEYEKYRKEGLYRFKA